VLGNGSYDEAAGRSAEWTCLGRREAINDEIEVGTGKEGTEEEEEM